MSTRLDSENATAIPAKIAKASFDSDKLKPGIVHIGIGAFHRAHQAVFTELAVEAEPGDWGIVGVSLRSPGVRDALVPQNCLYTVMEKSSAGMKARLMSIVKDVMVAPENPAAVVDLLAAESTKICSLTITEKGYCTDPATGMLDFSREDVQHDLKHISTPKTMVGFVVSASQKRRDENRQGFTLMSCDNLSHNGEVAKKAVMAFAEKLDAGLADWIAAHVSFVSTMVDRIVPATTEKDLVAVKNLLGVDDLAAVVCEPYRQWVVQDNFPYGRPAWEKSGAMMVDDVLPFETLKLRTLNGVHSALAYLGYLCGYAFIHQAIADPVLLRFVKHLMDIEIHPTLDVPAGLDIEEYKELVRNRFANTEIQYKTSQVAMDGSQKLPQRLLGTVLENIEAGRPCDAIAMVVAAWIRYLGGKDENGVAIPVSDPLADQLRKAYDSAKVDSQSIVSSVMSASGLFDGELSKHVVFRERVVVWFDMILSKGTKTAVEMFILELVGSSKTDER